MKKSYKIVRGGIYTALSVIIIYISSILPTSRLFLLSAASAIMPMSIVTIGIKYSLIVYAAVSILSFLVLGFRFECAAYIIFFGLYGFVKCFAERFKTLPLELLVKFLFFNLCLIIITFGLKLMIKIPMQNSYMIYVSAVVLQVIFYIYDYVLTLFIQKIIIKYLT